MSDAELLANVLTRLMRDADADEDRPVAVIMGGKTHELLIMESGVVPLSQDEHDAIGRCFEQPWELLVTPPPTS